MGGVERRSWYLRRSANRCVRDLASSSYARRRRMSIEPQAGTVSPPSRSGQMHPETFVKVNARVDVGVAPLVTALSSLQGVETVESCQGGAGHQAFVLFRYGQWRDCGALLFDQILAEMEPDLRADVSLEIIGYDTTNCLGRISVTPEAIEALAKLVRRAHKCACSDDTKRT